MFDKLESALRYQQEALNLRAERQKVLANNIANADTPNFKARDFDFRAELDRVMQQGRSAGEGGLSLNRTSSRHIAAEGPRFSGVDDLLYRVPDQPSLDGNTVDMNRERAAFADNSVRYQADVTFVSRRIQGLKKAMQPE
ncbi:MULTISPECIES: flagellar basal body rod protein FlgB [unclassified Salinicola]|uniref:flagellar basal body rod protein FlgB n=1 Tax=unclassified Salinicola TaxID=2634022 RepID=UPI001A8D91CD|nr:MULTISPECIES: flagellar basal body rod protein FlgB [unclassified Salinicola]MCE3025828.1 flagellar basal body rod protein FlgB [Salinicola sp. DM10]WIX34753.1 flagellar basal body rod protein FlgB [Salinicola sp. JS01]